MSETEFLIAFIFNSFKALLLKGSSMQICLIFVGPIELTTLPDCLKK